MRLSNPRGGYDFLSGIRPYSAGAVAQNGYEIEHARFLEPLDLKTGFEAVEAHLRRMNRPKQALCGIELRSPRPFSFSGFEEFNKGYVAVLRAWDILLAGEVNPVARTNVAPEISPPAQPCLYGFSYTVPSESKRRTFVLAGAGELPEGSLDPHEVVRRGETSPEAIREKARFVMKLMQGRLQGLGLSWADATMTAIYTVHDIGGFLRDDILRPMGKASGHGVHWYYARPPIETIEYEMDVRGTLRDLMLS
ncbi:MAG: hypothetical protein NZV14_02615 [Bryobacteraceae bacterium]|nr:hypothetical protein [Bryobacteraceae bacterium]MDW8377025.1 hypothetical protein [Bryobacterales bacterium]